MKNEIIEMNAPLHEKIYDLSVNSRGKVDRHRFGFLEHVFGLGLAEKEEIIVERVSGMAVRYSKPTKDSYIEKAIEKWISERR